MADFRIGDNLNATADGKWYSIETGKKGRYKNFVTSPYDAAKNKVNDLYNAQQKGLLDQLHASQKKAVAGFNQQKIALAPQYQQQRNQVDVQGQQNVQKLRELMAANGINASGENVTASSNLQAARQGALSDVNNNERQAVAQIDKQIADVNDPSQEQGILNNIASDRNKALLDAYNQGQQATLEQRNNWQQQQRYNDDKAWRQYTYNNMSAAEKAQFAQNASQFGEEMAWKYYENKANNEASSAQSQAELDYYKDFTGDEKGSVSPQSFKPGTTSFQSNLKQAISKGVPSSYAPIMTEIARRESSWNPKALNKSSGTYGYAQFQEYNVDSYNKKYGLDYRNNPVHQLVAMYHYIKDRYKTPEKALAFWNKNHWY